MTKILLKSGEGLLHANPCESVQMKIPHYAGKILNSLLSRSPGEASNNTQHPLKSHNILDLNPSLKTTGFSGEGFRS